MFIKKIQDCAEAKSHSKPVDARGYHRYRGFPLTESIREDVLLTGLLMTSTLGNEDRVRGVVVRSTYFKLREC
jgi:hypothetical protein